MIIIGLSIFFWHINRLRNVTCLSEDGTAELILKNATRKDIERKSGYEFNFYPYDAEDFYEKIIEKNPSYVYAVDDNNSQVRAETGTYVFCVNHRYFCIKADEWDDKLYGFRELINDRPQISNLWASDTGTVISPLRSDYDFPMSEEPVFYSWSDTYGLSSYEDLVDFYARTGEEMYTLKEDDKTILISVYAHGKWHPDAMQLRVRDDNTGFDVLLLRYIKEESIQYDER